MKSAFLQIIAFFFIGLVSSLLSAPLRNFPQVLVQPNGEVIHCFASGDEYHNWLHDAEGYTIIQHPITGYYTYAVISNGELTASSYIVGEVNPKTLGLEKWLNISSAVLLQKRDRALRNLPRERGLAPKTGTISNIVIFIRFNGESEFTDLKSTYENMFNSSISGYNSMYNYFREVSYNTLTITSTFYPTSGSSTVVSYQDTYSRRYYQPYSATNTIGYTTDSERTSREHTLLRNAINSVNTQIPSALNLDGDNDGRVDNICFIISGPPDGWSDLLWPHMWALYSQTAFINDKRVWDYNFQLQNSLLSNGVGVLCHEMFHTLGAPDLYHYSYDGLQPVYKWDIMEWDLNPPQHMGAYMKYRYGSWISSIPVITTSGTYSLNPLTSSTNNCYRINSPNSSTEYFILEYRRMEGIFESSLPGEGLLVYRINTLRDGLGNSNGPPDEVYIYRPNGTTSSNGNPINANFSSNVGRTSITDASNPSSFLSNGNPGGLNVSNIGSIGNSITFTVTIPGSSTISVVSPNGGENWQAGSTQSITWTSAGVTNVKIENSTNNGTNWTTIIASTPANAGSYTWTVPNTPSSQCKVRVSDASNSSVNDLSDNVFTISPTPTISILAPNGGENWQAGTYQNITWTSTAVINVKIDYTTNNGTNWTTIIASTPANAGSYTWTVPNTPSSQCKVRVSDASNSSVNDLSDNVFTISPAPTISILAPNGGENWQAGTYQNITWTSTAVINVKIEYTTNNGTNWTTIIASTPANAGSYTWTVPNTPSSQCKVRVSDASNFSVNDLSDNVFTISPAPTISILAPNGGENWQAGTYQNITWTSTAVINVKIEYTTNNGTNWTTIIASTPANAGSYTWTVPNTPSTQSKVRLSDASNSSINSVSSNSFTISPMPTITLISPNGEEKWQVGTSQNITWTSSGLTNIKIEYSTNNSSSWSTIIASTSASSGSYSWIVPNTPSIQCRVKVSDASNSSLSDQSDNVFTILPLLPNAPTLISPLNNVINQPSRLTLIWYRIQNAEGYRIQLFDSTANNILLDDSTITDTSKQLVSLANRTLYHWHVQAKNSSGWSAFSEKRNFRVMNLKGDLDGNNRIQALDAAYILQYAVGLREFDSMQWYAADVNNDNAVGAYDAAWVLYFVVFGSWPNW